MPKTKDPTLNLKTDLPSVEEYEFEPIKGYPMLHWKGKRPFYSTQFYPAQLKEQFGEEVDGWMNQIFWGDNLQVMSHLLKNYRGKVDLIYIDPPFDSKADYKKKIQLKGKQVTNDSTAFEEKQYSLAECPSVPRSGLPIIAGSAAIFTCRGNTGSSLFCTTANG